jgi:hypothetical protein
MRMVALCVDVDEAEMRVNSRGRWCHA